MVQEDLVSQWLQLKCTFRLSFFILRHYLATAHVVYRAILNPLLRVACEPLILIAWSVGFPLILFGRNRLLGLVAPLHLQNPLADIS
jgi:hypothetical protein